jgi:hypothetical protein
MEVCPGGRDRLREEERAGTQSARASPDARWIISEQSVNREPAMSFYASPLPIRTFFLSRQRPRGSSPVVPAIHSEAVKSEWFFKLERTIQPPLLLVDRRIYPHGGEKFSLCRAFRRCLPVYRDRASSGFCCDAGHFLRNGQLFQRQRRFLEVEPTCFRKV